MGDRGLVRGLLLAAGLVASAGAAAGPDPVRSAGDLFREGKFAEAEAAYAAAGAKDSDSFEAALGLGTLALLKNDLAGAERWLTKATSLKPEAVAAKKALALLYYRRDDFAKAAPLYRALDAEAMAKKLESFRGLAPYRVEGKSDATRIPFVHTDPLPLVPAKVNGRDVNLLLDTGGSEIFLDPDVAGRVGAARYGSETGTYAGGKRAETGHGRVDSVTLGDFVVRDVPVLVLSTRPFSAVARGKRVDGVLGTVMLAHFLATIDYPGGRLVLRRKTKDQLEQCEKQASSAKGVVVPFWMSGDHFMVARGRVNKSGPLLFFADTGMAGAGFTCPDSTMKEAGIPPPKGPGAEGVGGGGKVKVVPFEVAELSLGDARARNVRAFAGVFPPGLEYGEGFRIGGLISHQFFRPYALTLDFTGMRLFLAGGKP